MKPPPRIRKKPKRIACPGAVPRSPSKVEWKRNEQIQLLKALKTLSEKNTGQEDIDYVFLNKQVPTRSTSEISLYVEYLKEKVISLAKVQLKLNSHKEKEGRKPIQVWTQMASSLARAHEDAISCAFSQMLTISSTEPRTLRNCDPPRVHRPPTGGCSVAMRLIPPLTDRADRFPILKTPPPALGPARRMQGFYKVVRMPNRMPTAPPTAASSSETLSAPPTVQPTASQTVTTSSDSTVEVTTQNVDHTGNLPNQQSTPPAAPSSVDPPFRPTAGAASGTSASGNSSGTSAEFIVDFEKIYLYMSAVHKPDSEHKLSPMESAIVLDLLMSLPKELPLLNCSRLHKHFIQMYECLSSPANSRAARDTWKHLRDQLSAQTGEPSGQHGIKPPSRPDTESSESNNTRVQAEEVDVMGSCLLLNPFLVPLKLLKRR